MFASVLPLVLLLIPPQDRPATAEDAAKVLDLASMPLMEGAADVGGRSLATLNYHAPATVRGAAKHIRQVFAERKWAELPDSVVNDEYAANATFARDGYKVSLMILPYGNEKPGHVTVSITNHGNVDTQTLPVPAGCKPFYATSVSCAYLCDLSVEEARKAVDGLLDGQHWEPYGTAGDVRDFKQNNIKLSARVSAAPAQDGKTVIDYSTMLMSADLPAPADATRVQYSDTPTQLSIDLPGTVDDAVAYYRKALGDRGWTGTTNHPIREQFKQFLVFRNAAKDMLDLEITVVDDKPRLLLRFRAAAELEDLEKKLKK